MLDTLLSGPFVPFTLSIALLFGLLALEVALLVIGVSLIGDGPDVDAPEFDAEFDLDAADFDAVDVDAAELDGFETEAPGGNVIATTSAPLDWIGFGKMPMLIWLACLLTAFGVTGIALQSVVSATLGGPLPALVAAIPSTIAAAWFTGRFGALFARFLPKTESQSVSARQLGRRQGTVTQGTAQRGNPAEVRVTDRYGNTHYLRAEPLKDADVIPQGTEVLVLRHRPTGGFRLIPL